jgi:signal transduction histidine kinase
MGNAAMPLLNGAMAHFENLQRKLGLSPRLRRMGGVIFLLLVGWFDYVTPPQLASAPFYLVVLIPIAFLESVPICLAYSVLAAVIYFGADVLTHPSTATLVYPYWMAFARLISFSLISSAISVLVGERRRLQLSEQALQDKARELKEKNRALEETLWALNRLQEEIVAKERQAATAETINLATYEIERPLISISFHVQDLLRSVEPHEDIHPLVEKIAERVGDMEGILKNIRELRKGMAG